MSDEGHGPAFPAAQARLARQDVPHPVAPDPASVPDKSAAPALASLTAAPPVGPVLPVPAAVVAEDAPLCPRAVEPPDGRLAAPPTAAGSADPPAPVPSRPVSPDAVAGSSASAAPAPPPAPAVTPRPAAVDVDPSKSAPAGGRCSAAQLADFSVSAWRGPKAAQRALLPLQAARAPPEAPGWPDLPPEPLEPPSAKGPDVPALLLAVWTDDAEPGAPVPEAPVPGAPASDSPPAPPGPPAAVAAVPLASPPSPPHRPVPAARHDELLSSRGSESMAPTPVPLGADGSASNAVARGADRTQSPLPRAPVASATPRTQLVSWEGRLPPRPDSPPACCSLFAGPASLPRHRPALFLLLSAAPWRPPPQASSSPGRFHPHRPNPSPGDGAKPLLRLRQLNWNVSSSRLRPAPAADRGSLPALPQAPSPIH